MSKTEEKTLDTLVEDIYSIVENGKEFSKESIRKLSQRIALVVHDRWKERTEEASEFRLRPSNIGTPDRKLWFDSKVPAGEKKWEPQQLLNFFFGDVWEEILLWLAEEAGHKVENVQGKVSMEGMHGRMDAKIDGVVVDVKTAANPTKFTLGTVLREDPYGYMHQAAFYTQADEGKDFVNCENNFAWLSSDKIGGLHLLELDSMELPDARGRVRKARKILKLEEPPEEKCFKPEPYGKSGNEILNKNCTWCPHLKECWKGELRAFQYANGVKYFTKIENEPNVPEIDLDE